MVLKWIGKILVAIACVASIATEAALIHVGVFQSYLERAA